GGHWHPAARRPDAGGARCHLHGDGARPRIEALGDDGGPLRLHRPHGVHLVPHALGGVDARAPAGADGDAHPHPPDGPRVLGERLLLHAIADFEGGSIQYGQLATGAYGEGYYDRRHPHTYVHELMFTGGDLLGRWDGDVVVSLSAGKGFAPFGTHDPMSRRPMLYPANHHLAQILERAVAVTAITAGKVTLEGGTFNEIG